MKLTFSNVDFYEKIIYFQQQQSIAESSKTATVTGMDSSTVTKMQDTPQPSTTKISTATSTTLQTVHPSLTGVCYFKTNMFVDGISYHHMYCQATS